jgi:diguanylate cyclase (GGDEF)-like protein/PAS domain S-box-containing protein
MTDDLSDVLSDGLFRAAFFQSPEAIALTRARDGVIAEVNEEWLSLTGYNRDEVVGRTAVDIGHWPDDETRERTLLPLKTAGRISDADVTLLMRDGMPRLVRMNASVVDVQGESFIILYLRDVTAERMSSEALRAGERVLEETNEKLNRQLKLHELTEAVAKVGYWITYPGSPVIHFSKGYADICRLGDERSALLGVHTRGIFAEDYPVFKRAIQAMNGEMTEFRWKHDDGSVVWIRTRMHRQVENGVAKADFGIVQEITAEKETLTQLQESEARFRALTALSSDWYWEQDENFRFLRVDGNLDTVNALPSHNYVGRTRWDSGAQGVSEESWEAHKSALMAHEVFHDFEMVRQRKDGTPMWVSISGTPVFDASGVFKGYRGTGRDISDRKKSEADIEQLAFFDALTGLPNRRMLIDRLNQALESSQRHMTHGALLFIDLDNFKVLNDTLGHHMGDELLKQVADRLGKCVRSIDTVARLGGDEFVVMLEDLGEDPNDAAAQTEVIGKKILSALNQEYELRGQRHHSSPSIGVTLFFQHLHGLDDLLKRADLAMYQAKAAGRNTLRFFDPVMQAAAQVRASVETDLRLGLQRNEFVLFYQPVVDESRRTTGVEALVRWMHPVRGMVPPSEFIHVAEQTGLILQLGQWVLETACQQLVKWGQQATTQRLTMAVNVSARQFRHPGFTEHLLVLLRSSGANPYRLKLELTESLLLTDIDDVIVKMGELRSIGVNFSLDDFGTGYSSLSYLKSLPLDQLKIDQSFVRDVLTDPNDAAIARTILNLALNLDLGVVAEGVETQGQFEFLLRCGCKSFQGYLFSRPVPVEELQLA